MMLPEQVCTVLIFPGEFIPHSLLVALAAIGMIVARAILALLPVSPQVAPLIGAAFAGFEVHKHRGIAFLLLYVVVSSFIVAGKIPVCA